MDENQKESNSVEEFQGLLKFLELTKNGEYAIIGEIPLPASKENIELNVSNLDEETYLYSLS